MASKNLSKNKKLDTKVGNAIREKFREIFSLNEYASVSVELVDGETLQVTFHDIDDLNVSFANLKKVSEYLHTDKIDAWSGEKEHGFCDTCSWTESLTTITVKDWKLK